MDRIYYVRRRSDGKLSASSNNWDDKKKIIFVADSPRCARKPKEWTKVHELKRHLMSKHGRKAYADCEIIEMRVDLTKLVVEFEKHDIQSFCMLLQL